MSAPDPDALADALRPAGPSATLDEVEPLTGGSHAKTFLVRTARPRREMVLREFPAGDRAAGDEAWTRELFGRRAI